jgi:hypothetical protein
MHSLFDRGTVQEEVYKNVLKTLNAASPETFGFDPNEYTIYMLDASSLSRQRLIVLASMWCHTKPPRTLTSA